jgi:O-antigen/teichoic acid export membrane protein
MKKTLGNAVYGALDYVCYPIGMLLLAPIVLRTLGPAEYGLWMVATSIVSGGAIIASGFGDAGIQMIAKMRARSEKANIEACAGVLFTITLALSVGIAAILWLGAPPLAAHLASDRGLTVQNCQQALHIASIMVLIRAVESVPVSVQRAFLEYGPGVRINIVVRFATLGLAALLSLAGRHVVQILLSSMWVMCVGLLFQFWNVRRFVALRHTFPLFDRRQLRPLFKLGIFGWMQSIGSVAFRQFDRILLGLSLGVAAVVPYTLSIQLSEPLFGLTASALSFFFPYLSTHLETRSTNDVRRMLRNAILCNLLVVLFGTVIVLRFGQQVLRHWIGNQIAQTTEGILVPITIGSALSGVSVVGVYAAQALGQFKVVATISVVSRCALLVAMFALLGRWGLPGLAVSRLLYGAAALLVYIPVGLYFKNLNRRDDVSPPLPAGAPMQEEGGL